MIWPLPTFSLGTSLANWGPRSRGIPAFPQADHEWRRRRTQTDCGPQADELLPLEMHSLPDTFFSLLLTFDSRQLNTRWPY